MADHYTLATCSYAQFSLDMGIPVRISLGVPKHDVPGFNPQRWIKPLTPGGDYFRASHAEFDRRFYEQLDKHGVAGLTEFFDQIAAKSDEDEPALVLLCFEKIPVYRGSAEEQIIQEADKCHRRMFARWWLAQTGELIPELRSGTSRHVAPTLW